MDFKIYVILDLRKDAQTWNPFRISLPESCLSIIVCSLCNEAFNNSNHLLARVQMLFSSKAV